jgi:hypothetical protein
MCQKDEGNSSVSPVGSIKGAGLYTSKHGVTSGGPMVTTSTGEPHPPVLEVLLVSNTRLQQPMKWIL